MPTPVVSVLLPVHNGMPYLPETVESLLAQTYRDFEVLALDDGSTDDSPAYLRSLSDPRVVYVRLEKVGLVGALNRGLELARGRLVARLDGDDVCHPTRLAEQVAYLDANPDCVLLGCDFDEIDTAGRVIGVNAYNVTGDPALRWLLHFCTPFLHPGVMYPTEACRRVGGYRPVYDVAEDFDLWCRLSRVGKLAGLPANLMKKRIHPGAVSVVKRDRGLTQSSQIAAEHARSVLPDIDTAAAADLYWLYQCGEIRGSSPRRVQATYRRLLGVHEGDGPDAEFALAVSYVGRKLGFSCTRNAVVRWRRPLQAVQWARAAGAFDPSRRNPLRVALRQVRRTKPRYSAMEDRVVAAAPGPQFVVPGA